VADVISPLQAAFDASTYHRLIDGRLVATDDGVVLEATVDERFSISLDRLHGGVVASLLDTAATWALIAVTGRPWVTADLRVDYIRAVPVGRVRVEGRIVRGGKRVGKATAAIVGPEGPLATAVGTLLPIDV